MSRWRPSVPALRPRARAGSGDDAAERARVLSDADVPEALAVCAGDPVASTLAAARLALAQHAGLHQSHIKKKQPTTRWMKYRFRGCSFKISGGGGGGGGG
ncbi:hypothetical protein QVL82_09305, partial [Cellulosimicrobium funkei]